MTEPRRVPDLGVGVGLRVPHYGHVLEQRPAIDFFEIISENFMFPGGKPRYHLDQVLETYRVIQHGVAMSIGAAEAPDREYLRKLKALVRVVRPAWLSDHFCWTGVPGGNMHDLLPLPYTTETVKLVSARARMVQDYLEVPFALENTSSYMAYRQSHMTEWQFVSEVCERAEVGLMFDVNNVYVSAYNHGFDAYEFIRNVPHDKIFQIHLAGHTNLGKYVIDTHNGNIIDEVWDLYRATIELAGSVSTLIEWDDDIPAFPALAALADKAKSVRDQVLAQRASEDGASFVDGRSLVPVPTLTGHSGQTWKQGGPREAAAEEHVTAAE